MRTSSIAFSDLLPTIIAPSARQSGSDRFRQLSPSYGRARSGRICGCWPSPGIATSAGTKCRRPSDALQTCCLSAGSRGDGHSRLVLGFGHRPDGRPRGARHLRRRRADEHRRYAADRWSCPGDCHRLDGGRCDHPRIPDEAGRPLVPREAIEKRRAVARELAGLEIEIETGEDVLVREQRIASKRTVKRDRSPPVAVHETSVSGPSPRGRLGAKQTVYRATGSRSRTSSTSAATS